MSTRPRLICATEFGTGQRIAFAPELVHAIIPGIGGDPMCTVVLATEGDGRSLQAFDIADTSNNVIRMLGDV